MSKRIWNIVRRAVRDMPGFEVTTDVVLGTFSFSKYLMWRDLVDRSDQLQQKRGSPASAASQAWRVIAAIERASFQSPGS